MKRLLDTNLNTQDYWNDRYFGQDKRIEYEKETGTSRFLRVLEEISDGQKVLDIGCGIGTFTAMVKGMYPNCDVWGTDISDKVTHQNWVENPSIKYIAQPVGEMKDVPDNYFDVVFSGEVLEHIEDPSILFKDALRVLKHRGKFIVTTPYGTMIQSPEHVWEYYPDDIEKLFKDNGFDRIQNVFLPNGEHLHVIMMMGKKL